MSASLVMAIVILVAVFYWMIRSRRKAIHHLDDLHIAGGPQGKR
jgi:hypothetical protein